MGREIDLPRVPGWDHLSPGGPRRGGDDARRGMLLAPPDGGDPRQPLPPAAQEAEDLAAARRLPGLRGRRRACAALGGDGEDEAAAEAEQQGQALPAAAPSGEHVLRCGADVQTPAVPQANGHRPRRRPRRRRRHEDEGGGGSFRHAVALLPVATVERLIGDGDRITGPCLEISTVRCKAKHEKA